MREQDKHFLWSLFAALGVILVWKGIWEGFYEIPYLDNAWLLLFIGLAILTLSGIIFKEFDPLGSVDKSTTKIVHYVHNHPRRKEFTFKYHDKIMKKDVIIRADKVKHLEKGSLVIEHENGKQEVFIPIHRIIEVIQNGKSYWRL